jgi:fructose-bisphosphate aldolase, class II
MRELREILAALNVGHPTSAIGAFNFNDMTDMQGIMMAAQRTRQPCIMMASMGAVKYMGLPFATRMWEAARETTDVPLYLMLDHSESVDDCGRCIDAGFSVVMFDGSALPFDENVRRTREVVSRARGRGTLVEAEIGRLPGREEHLDVSAMEALYADPREAKEFWEATGVDLLAIAFGTAHGFYTAAPKLDFEVIRQTRALTNAPIVMHGGTGVPDADVRKAVSCGVKKVNVGTELKHAYVATLRQTLAQNEKEIDPRKVIGKSREAVQKAVEGRLAVIGTPRIEEIR